MPIIKLKQKPNHLNSGFTKKSTLWRRDYLTMPYTYKSSHLSRTILFIPTVPVLILIVLLFILKKISLDNKLFGYPTYRAINNF